MLKDNNNIWQLAEAYVTGTLAEAELVALESKLALNEGFNAEFQEAVNLLRSMNGAGSQLRYRAMLKNIQQEKASTGKPPAKTIPLKTYYFRTAAVAAGIALLTSLSTFWAVQHNTKKMASQYSLLRRDLESYKRSQNQIINNIKDQKNVTPQAEVRYTGTGFAVTNDGYLVTNYHVVNGADSVYIQTREGKYYKAYIQSFDQQADLALLKVESKQFRFAKADVPYTFAPGKKGLGAKVFTIGYPQDDAVYNEGYISAKNGFQGDSIQYMLQLPASPGQSGAPVVDATGNVVAIITGKESESEGTTYAVNSKAILHLLQGLPKEANIKLPKTNKMAGLTREQQIEKMEYYTCSVKVYKK